MSEIPTAIPCVVPGHGHVGRCTTSTGLELPFCEPHVAALPEIVQSSFHELAEFSIFELDLQKAARVEVLSAIAWLLGRKEIPGICVACGCTQEFGCEDGCSWANKRQTLCSRCAPARASKRKARR